METLQYVLQIVSLIPSSFWGIVVGSLFSLGGVALTNWANADRLRQQFAHERLLKTKDREMALRKEVYLEAVEAVNTGIQSISRFANLDLPNDQVIADYLSKAHAIAKTHVIGTTDTVRAMVEFTNELGTLQAGLFAKRLELHNQRSQLAPIQQQIIASRGELDRLIETMKQMQIGGIADPGKWAPIQQAFMTERDKLNLSIGNLEIASKDLHAKHMAFMRECVARGAALSTTIVPILSAVRAELELPLDMEAYRAATEAGFSQQLDAIDDFIAKVTGKDQQPKNVSALEQKT